MAERTGTYTALDYADIVDHLVNRWKLASFTGERETGRYFCATRLGWPCPFPLVAQPPNATACSPAGLSSDAAKAQDYVCNLAPRIRKLAVKTAERKVSSPHGRRFLFGCFEGAPSTPSSCGVAVLPSPPLQAKSHVKTDVQFSWLFNRPCVI